MKIKATQEFLHDVKRYKAGRSYEVPEGLGTYFVMNGWASSDEVAATGEPVTDAVDLDVDDTTLGQSTEVK